MSGPPPSPPSSSIPEAPGAVSYMDAVTQGSATAAQGSALAVVESDEEQMKRALELSMEGALAEDTANVQKKARGEEIEGVDDPELARALALSMESMQVGRTRTLKEGIPCL